jgi:hypothetical protein
MAPANVLQPERDRTATTLTFPTQQLAPQNPKPNDEMFAHQQRRPLCSDFLVIMVHKEHQSPKVSINRMVFRQNLPAPAPNTDWQQAKKHQSGL